MYVFNDGKNVYEGMTKEQTLAAIVEAVETHEISDVDTGFVTTIKEKNRGIGLSFWVGSSAEYNALVTKPQNCICILSDDTTLDDIKAVVTALTAKVDNMANLKGQVLLDQEVEYGTGLSVALSGTNPIKDFTLVKVTVQQNGIYYDVLCTVEKGSINIIRGLSMLRYFDPKFVNIDLGYSPTNNTLTWQQSKTTTFSPLLIDPTHTAAKYEQENISIFKIVGVY